MSSSTKLGFSLTMMLLAFPALAQTAAPTNPGGDTGAKAASGDDAIYCRPPQQRADSRMMGPKVCLPMKRWNDLRAQGLDVGADGTTIVQGAVAPGMGAP
ncbi:MAG TPA: hypothetical protein VMU31_07825 [Rhizomicrobium sp.]|nr:hypothetical protein [Rhizomicrobium sp.]